eukprot:Pgem_evm1s8983
MQTFTFQNVEVEKEIVTKTNSLATISFLGSSGPVPTTTTTTSSSSSSSATSLPILNKTTTTATTTTTTTTITTTSTATTTQPLGATSIHNEEVYFNGKSRQFSLLLNLLSVEKRSVILKIVALCRSLVTVYPYLHETLDKTCNVLFLGKENVDFDELANVGAP